MKKFVFIFLGFALFLGCGKRQISEKPVILTSISVYQDIVKNIVGDAYEVRSLVSGMENPHTLDLSGSKAKLVQNADLIIFNGMGLEGWGEQVESGLKPKNTPLISVADSLKDHPLLTHGDNPHIWMDPRIVQSMSKIILSSVQKLQPDSADIFRKRTDHFVGALDTLYQDVGYKLEPLAGSKVVAQAPGLDYFFSSFNIDRAAVIVDHPGTEPSAKAMTVLTDILKSGEIISIVRLPQFSKKIPQTLSEETGVPVISMSPLINGTQYVQSYIDLVWYNADQLSLLAEQYE
ncbi:MAG: Manganese-binding lipoprotein MntA [Candidatus Marinimicrobia bacterium]|nr:Manganese-binding lipoprotein MntA [Candidatus Neomarinimicrobiota bacterium]